MANKVEPVTTTDKIRTADNIRITMFNEGNIGQALTESEILDILEDSSKELIVRNKTSKQIEWWFVENGKKIRRRIG